ncbi:MAG: AMP-binding protein [Rhodobacteraceae bacterium]|nr:AMP-binding protein [Paracoccaceae bacterium]PHR55655.1 MAG: cyclohexanecarboxylate-CoA ligase [Robiginitomaculum sp.]
MTMIDARLAELATTARSLRPKGRVLGAIALELTKIEPQRIVMRDGERSLTRRCMLDHALRLGGGLRARGLARGAVIAFQLPNWWEACVINLAASLFGFRIVPMLTIYRRAELNEIVTACGIEAIFVPQTYRNTDFVALVESLTEPPRHVLTVRGANNSADCFERLIEAAPAAPDLANSDDAKLIIFTSGSTGQPKGVIHSHDTMDALISQTAAFWGTGRDDVLYVASPIGHVGGAIYAFEFPWITECQIFLEESWQPAQAVARIEAENITFMAGATPFLSGLLDAAQHAGRRLPSLRRFVCGGASVPPELIIRGLDAFPNCVVSRAFGSSEVALVCPGVRTRSAAEIYASTDGEGTADIRVLDADNVEVPIGTEGEIAVRAPQMFLGYLNKADETGCFTDDGYFLMGDLGRIVDGKYVVVTGRTKDTIIRKGENISPLEIENALMRHGAIRHCSVVGRPDMARGEMVVAFVVLETDASFDFETMTRHFEKLGLARQKTPEALEIIDDLPMNAVGKVQKPKLREMALRLASDAVRP